MDEEHLKLLDFILPTLSEKYPDSIKIMDLTHQYKKSTGSKFNHKQVSFFVNTYDSIYFNKSGQLDQLTITTKTKHIIDNFGSLTKYFEENEKLIQKEKSSSDEITKLKTENLALQNKNLILQNKRLKRHVLYSIISFIAGAILTNIKDILILLNILK